MFTIRIVSSSTPGAAELSAVLDAAAWANARWIEEERDRGRDPPCCLECADVLYLPDAPSANRISIATGYDLIARRHASCGEVAAYVLGIRRANAARAGLDPRTVGAIELRRTAADVYHAVVRLADGSTIDDTETMRHG